MGSLPTFTLELSPLDQIAPRIYVRTIFIFSLGDDYNAATAKAHLRNCFHRALVRWPFLSGQIRPAAGGKNRLELVYDVDDSSMDLDKRSDLFFWEHVDHLKGYTYRDLVERGMPPNTMDKDILSASPHHPKMGESCAPVTLKVTELGHGEGLLVCFSTHHGIFDGGFIRTFVEFFSSNTEMGKDSFTRELSERPKMYNTQVIKDITFPEYDFSIGPGPIFNKAPKAICKIVQFKNNVVKDLQQQSLQHLREKHGVDAFVSMADTLCATVWVHVTRSRLSHLRPSDKTSFTTAVDARSRLSPAFPSSSWGNIYTQTAAITNVGLLVQIDDAGNTPTNTVPAIAEAAWLIRQAIVKTSDPKYIPSRIALAASLEDPAMEGAAFRKGNRPDHAGLGCSVWVHMGADVDFRIPGTGGRADYVRKTWSANDGAMNIMQRRGVTKGDALWEVLLALREDDMERVSRPGELGLWAESWIT